MPKRTPAAPPQLKTIRLPKRLAAQLGDNPARAIRELMKLRKNLKPLTDSRDLQALAANPFRDVRLDQQRVFRPFITSTLAGLREWRGTEQQLVDEALRVSGKTLATLAHDGLLREAALEVSADFRRRQAPTPEAPQHGIRGARDQELLEAAGKLRDALKPVSASALRGLTGISFRTCQSFLERYGDQFNSTPPQQPAEPSA
jgi:hypothetical protein